MQAANRPGAPSPGGVRQPFASSRRAGRIPRGWHAWRMAPTQNVDGHPVAGLPCHPNGISEYTEEHARLQSGLGKEPRTTCTLGPSRRALTREEVAMSVHEVADA